MDHSRRTVIATTCSEMCKAFRHAQRENWILTLTSVHLSSITTAAKCGKQVLLPGWRRGGDREDLKSFWKAPIQTPSFRNLASQGHVQRRLCHLQQNVGMLHSKEVEAFTVVTLQPGTRFLRTPCEHRHAYNVCLKKTQYGHLSLVWCLFCEVYISAWKGLERSIAKCQQ